MIEQEICKNCGKTLREQMKGCNEITCYRQFLVKDKAINNEAKEKAIEIFNKYHVIVDRPTSLHCILYQMRCSKKFALIAVNEIINSNPHSNPINTEQYSTMEYWIEVRKELQKLKIN